MILPTKMKSDEEIQNRIVILCPETLDLVSSVVVPQWDSDVYVEIIDFRVEGTHIICLGHSHIDLWQFLDVHPRSQHGGQSLVRI